MEDIFDLVREIAAELPEAEESTWFAKLAGTLRPVSSSAASPIDIGDRSREILRHPRIALVVRGDEVLLGVGSHYGSAFLKPDADDNDVTHLVVDPHEGLLTDLEGLGLGYKQTVEPLLRQGATVEIDTSLPLSDKSPRARQGDAQFLACNGR